MKAPLVRPALSISGSREPPTATAKVTLAEAFTGYTLDPDHRVIGVDAAAIPAAPALPLPVWIF